MTGTARPRPAVPKAAPMRPPQWEVHAPPSGPRTMLTHLPLCGMTAARLVLGFGPADDPPGLEGVSRMLVEAMALAPAGREPDAFAEDLARAGATLTPECLHDGAALTLTAPAEWFADAFRMVVDVAERPALTGEGVAQTIERRRSEIAHERRRADVQAMQAFLRAGYGTDTAFGRPSGGTLASLDRIDRSAVRDHHTRRLGPGNATLLLAGDLSGTAGARTRRLVAETMDAWRPRTGTTARTAEPAPAGDGGTAVVDVGETAQAALVLGRIIPALPPEQAAALDVAVHALGGWFGSRLNTLLRESKGLTYGTAAATASRRVPEGRVCRAHIETAVERSMAAAAAATALAEIERCARDGLTETDVRAAADHLVRSRLLGTQTARQVVERYGRAAQRGHDPESLDRHAELILAADTAAVSGALADHLGPDRLVLVAAGEAAALEAVWPRPYPVQKQE